jgi:hypothetical protein
MEQIGRLQVYSSSASECYQTRSKPRENEAHEVRSAVHFTRDNQRAAGHFGLPRYSHLHGVQGVASSIPARPTTPTIDGLHLSRCSPLP